MKYVIILLMLMIIVQSLAVANPGDETWGNDINKISLLLQNNEYGDKQGLALEIVNERDENVVITNDDGYFVFMVFGNDGKLLKEREGVKNILPLKGYMHRYTILNSTARCICPIDIDKYYDLTKAGTYRVLVAWKIDKIIYVSNLYEIVR